MHTWWVFVFPDCSAPGGALAPGLEAKVWDPSLPDIWPALNLGLSQSDVPTYGSENWGVAQSAGALRDSMGMTAMESRVQWGKVTRNSAVQGWLLERSSCSVLGIFPGHDLMISALSLHSIVPASSPSLFLYLPSQDNMYLFRYVS